MTIHFYLRNEEETQIMTFHDLESNPFKIGDKIFLTVDELFPIDYSKFEKELQKKFILDNNERHSTFNRKKIEIVKEGKHVCFNGLNSINLTIEYHCVFCNK